MAASDTARCGHQDANPNGTLYDADNVQGKAHHQSAPAAVDALPRGAPGGNGTGVHFGDKNRNGLSG